MRRTSISIGVDTRDLVRECGKKSESYDLIIHRIVKGYLLSFIIERRGATVHNCKEVINKHEIIERLAMELEAEGKIVVVKQWMPNEGFGFGISPNEVLSSDGETFLRFLPAYGELIPVCEICGNYVQLARSSSGLLAYCSRCNTVTQSMAQSVNPCNPLEGLEGLGTSASHSKPKSSSRSTHARVGEI